MGYLKKYDANLNPVNEAISGLKRIDISTGTLLTNYSVEVPSGAYGVIIKRSPIDFELKINDFDTLPVSEGDYFSPILDGVKSVLITTSVTSSTSIVLVFIK